MNGNSKLQVQNKETRAPARGSPNFQIKNFNTVLRFQAQGARRGAKIGRSKIRRKIVDRKRTDFAAQECAMFFLESRSVNHGAQSFMFIFKPVFSPATGLFFGGAVF